MIQKLKKLFTKENSLGGATVLLMFTLVCSNILGLFRNRFLAQKLTQESLDIYLSAFRIPDLIFNLLILGAITIAFIPILSKYVVKKDLKSAWHITSSVLNFALLALIFLLLTAFFLMPYIMPKIVPGFDPARLAQAIFLSRLMLLSPFFFGLSYIFSGVANAFKRYFAYSVAPLFYNLSIILAVLLFADKLGVLAPTIGVLAGAFLHMVIQVPPLLSLGFCWKPVLDFKNADFTLMLRLAGPRILTLLSIQAIWIAFNILASLKPGSITYLNFANDIQTFFSVVFASSFAIALFPFLSESQAKKDKEQFEKFLEKGVQQILYFILFSSVVLVLLRVEIIRVILGTGYFGWKATIITANTMAVFAIGLVGASLIQLLARAFYSLHDAKTPAIVSVVSAGLSIGLGWFLVRWLFAQNYYSFWAKSDLITESLAFAFAVGSIINWILLWIFLRKKYQILPVSSFWADFIKLALSALGAGAVIQLTKMLVGELVNMQAFWGVFVKLVVSLGVGAFAYWLTARFLKCDYSDELILVFKRKIGLVKDESCLLYTSPSPRD